MQTKIILCTGGSRSGKSEFAEKLVLSLPGSKGYVATSQIFDAEMEARVAKHKARRKSEWLNFEIPFDLSNNWHLVDHKCDVILVDCITMYITNQLLTYNLDSSQAVKEEAEGKIVEDIENLLQIILQSSNKTVVFVTNELGLSVVPDNTLGRVFRDITGIVNQKIADLAQEVYLTVSGITIEIKSKGVHIDG